MNTKSLGLTLLNLRQSHNLTQKQLCDALNLGRSTYSYYETGRRTPDIETLLMIAEYYQITLDELITTGTKDSPLSATAKTDSTESDIQLSRHLKAKHIPIQQVLQLSKADFDFLQSYKQLSEENKSELSYLLNYKLRRQKK